VAGRRVWHTCHACDKTALHFPFPFSRPEHGVTVIYALNNSKGPGCILSISSPHQGPLVFRPPI